MSPISEYQAHLEAIAAILAEHGLDPSAAGALDAAADILTDDGMSIDRAFEILIAALRDGQPLDAFARHVVDLRKAVR